MIGYAVMAAKAGHPLTDRLQAMGLRAGRSARRRLPATRGHPRLVFELHDDAKLLAQSRPMRFGDEAQLLQAPVEGVELIELVAKTRERREWRASARLGGSGG